MTVFRKTVLLLFLEDNNFIPFSLETKYFLIVLLSVNNYFSFGYSGEKPQPCVYSIQAVLLRTLFLYFLPPSVEYLWNPEQSQGRKVSNFP